jgi:hypothetical protein
MKRGRPPTKNVSTEAGPTEIRPLVTLGDGATTMTKLNAFIGENPKLSMFAAVSAVIAVTGYLAGYLV